MFSFPVNLQDNGIQKFTNNADSGFPKIQQKEVFYSLRDGNWGDAIMFQTASGRVGLTPTVLDDVYIRHTITINVANINVNNLYVAQNATLITDGTARTFTVNGNINSLGTINLSTSNAAHNLQLLGVNNTITNLITGTGSSVTYISATQNILDLPYRNLTILGGYKILTVDTIVSGNLFIYGYGTLECNGYALTVNGTSQLGANAVSGGTIAQRGSANLLFIGAVQFDNCTVSFTGNPITEFRGGVKVQDESGGGTNFNFGTNLVKFTTNNQSLTGTSINNFILFTCPVLISGAITLTINYTAGTSMNVYLNDIINGDNASSTLVLGSANVNTSIYFQTQLSAENSMSTGIVDFTTNANAVQYAGNYSATIPSRFPSFYNLTISGTGTKTLSVNTTLSGNLGISSGTFELSTFNLSILGTTGITGTLSKTGAGNVLFTGLLTLNTGFAIAFSGNPTVEVRGGIFQQFQGAGNISSGTGQWTFSTNNQSIYNNNGVGSNSSLSFNAPILISGAITLTSETTAGSDTILILNQPINGNNAASTLSVKASVQFNTLASTASMTTGIFDITATQIISGYQSIRYAFNGDYTIPYTSFAGLVINGTGTKSLSNNTTLSKYLTVASSGKLECSTYNLTVTGVTTANGGFLSKTGAGSLVFIGNVNTGNGITFTGNPTIEFRGGIRFNQTNLPNLGNGQITFTTNNQSIDYSNGLAQSVNLSNNILISGAITVTVSSLSAALTIVSGGTINGDNASSKLLMGVSGNVTYNASTRPMITGILDTSTNLNTWIYGLNAQDILGGPTTLAKQVYRNLTLNGTGVKTLQGYVSVLNTYTLTSPATLALNGFTLTNP